MSPSSSRLCFLLFFRQSSESQPKPVPLGVICPLFLPHRCPLFQRVSRPPSRRPSRPPCPHLSQRPSRRPSPAEARSAAPSSMGGGASKAPSEQSTVLMTHGVEAVEPLDSAVVRTVTHAEQGGREMRDWEPAASVARGAGEAHMSCTKLISTLQRWRHALRRSASTASGPISVTSSV